MITKSQILFFLLISNILSYAFATEAELVLVQPVETAEAWAELPSLGGKDVSLRLYEVTQSQMHTLYLLGGKSGATVSTALSKMPKKFLGTLVFDANRGKMTELTVPSTDPQNQPCVRFKLVSIKNDNFTAEITFIAKNGEEGHIIKIEEHWKNFEFFFAVYLGPKSTPVRLDQFLLICFKLH